MLEQTLLLGFLGYGATLYLLAVAGIALLARRYKRNAALWSLAALFFTPLIVLVVALIVGPKGETK